MTTLFGDYIYPDQPATCPQCGASADAQQPLCKRCKFDLRFGSLKNDKKGICIYCGDVRSLTDEHIFPKWLQDQFPKRHLKTAHTLTRPVKAESLQLAELHETTTSRAADPYDTKVRNVCVDCNGGWMSALQNSAKPLVLEQALGNLRALSAEEENILARWAAMTAISLQSLGRQLITGEIQRSALKSGTMPEAWRVTRGVMVDTSFAGLSLSRPFITYPQVGDGEYVRTNMTLIVIERAVFQTFCGPGSQTFRLAFNYSGISAQALPMQPVWPPGSQWDDVSGLAMTRLDLAKIPRLLAD